MSYSSNQPSYTSGQGAPGSTEPPSMGDNSLASSRTGGFKYLGVKKIANDCIRNSSSAQPCSRKDAKQKIRNGGQVLNSEGSQIAQKDADAMVDDNPLRLLACQYVDDDLNKEVNAIYKVGNEQRVGLFMIVL